MEWSGRGARAENYSYHWPNHLARLAAKTEAPPCYRLAANDLDRAAEHAEDTRPYRQNLAIASPQNTPCTSTLRLISVLDSCHIL